MKPRIEIFGMAIDALRMQDVVDQIFRWVSAAEAGCRYVVTPNVDHAVIFQEHEGLQRAYTHASLVLADGMPILLASRILRRPLPERVPGSDLVPALFAEAAHRRSLRVYLLGAAPGVAEQAAARTQATWPAVHVVGTYSPPLGFEKDAEQNRQILDRIAAARPDVLVVGLGAPKQELWLAAHRHEIRAPVALAVGATIDFLAGEKARAPKWMRVAGLEWLHRLASEPRRLFRRYARDAWIFPQLLLRELRRGPAPPAAPVQRPSAGAAA
jgi:N-acetylglucosaminyldiphosphoundecaprenol N-acetyl-beta-D-mannosaminyltransferase